MAESNPKKTVAEQRAIQAQVAKADKKPKKKGGAMQAGARRYPEPPLAAAASAEARQAKRRSIRPRCTMRPSTRDRASWSGMAAIITGGDRGSAGRWRSCSRVRAPMSRSCISTRMRMPAVTKKAVEKEGRRAIVIAGDVRDQAFCKAAVEEAFKAFGRLDILVNNAAFQVHSTFADLTAEHFDQTLKTNLYGYFFMAQAAVAKMKPGGAIVNTGSGHRHLGQQGSARLFHDQGRHPCLYPQPRHASDLRKASRVNAVAPGPVWTPLNPSDKEAPDVGAVRRRHPDEAAGPTRRNRAGLCLPGVAAMFQLHHGRDIADHRRLCGRVSTGPEVIVLECTENRTVKRDFRQANVDPKFSRRYCDGERARGYSSPDLSNFEGAQEDSRSTTILAFFFRIFENRSGDAVAFSA